jgi:hypothetical protein
MQSVERRELVALSLFCFEAMDPSLAKMMSGACFLLLIIDRAIAGGCQLGLNFFRRAGR